MTTPEQNKHQLPDNAWENPAFLMACAFLWHHHNSPYKLVATLFPYSTKADFDSELWKYLTELMKGGQP